VTAATAPPSTTVVAPPPAASIASAPATPVPATLARAVPTRRPAPAQPEPSLRATTPVTLAAAANEDHAPRLDEPLPEPSIAPPPPSIAPAFGVLNLIVVPPAEVFVDEESHGVVSSQEFRLSAGDHDLRFEHPRYKPYKRRVPVPAGASVEFVLDLSEKGVLKAP
jgi:hypothetical protein